MPEHTNEDPENWVEQHADNLFRYAMVRVRNRPTAEDLVQDTLLAAWRNRAHRRGSSSERSWLTGILKHKIADYFRRHGRETNFTDLTFCRREFADEFRSQFWDHAKGPRDWGKSAADGDESADLREVIGLCLGKLPDRVAAVFTMREIDDVSGADICRSLQLTESNLWTMLHRARMAMRHCLEKNWFAPA